MGFFKEFKEFAIKGNVVDLAVAVIIGAAFGKIVDSAVQDLVMPLIAAVIGSPDFSQAYYAFGEVPAGTPLAQAKEMAPVFAYGNFITIAINFLLIALAIFIMVKAINRLKKQPPPPEAAVEEVSSTDKLLTEIRDALKNK